MTGPITIASISAYPASDAARVRGVDGVVYQGATTYAAVQAANDPVNIEAQNETRFNDLVARISKRRGDDYQRCMDMFASEAGVTPSYSTDVSACNASFG
jgi:hypothetical protein